MPPVRVAVAQPPNGTIRASARVEEAEHQDDASATGQAHGARRGLARLGLDLSGGAAGATGATGASTRLAVVEVEDRLEVDVGGATLAPGRRSGRARRSGCRRRLDCGTLVGMLSVLIGQPLSGKCPALVGRAGKRPLLCADRCLSADHRQVLVETQSKRRSIEHMYDGRAHVRTNSRTSVEQMFGRARENFPTFPGSRPDPRAASADEARRTGSAREPRPRRSS